MVDTILGLTTPNIDIDIYTHTREAEHSSTSDSLRRVFGAEMKRLVRSNSGRQIYGPKWQNKIGGTNENESDDESSEIAQVPDNQNGNPDPVLTSEISSVAATVGPETYVDQLPITGQPKGQNNENQTSKGNGTSGSLLNRQLMYKAALQDDWLAAEMLLEKNPSLAYDEITERGDRALHVAAAMKHEVFVRKLVKRIDPSDLEMLDGPRCYTAFCYAATSGVVEIADVLRKANPKLVTVRDGFGQTPLYKAARCGNKKMVSYILKFTNVEDLSKEEWFKVLLVAIDSKMYDVALKIVERDGSLATMTEGDQVTTPLHRLARVDISAMSTSRRAILLKSFLGTNLNWREIDGRMQPDLRSLARKLFNEMKQKLREDRLLELIKSPSIIHDAAKLGNVELITMLTRHYPDLIWNTDKDGYSIFHIAVIYRQGCVFSLIQQIGGMTNFIVSGVDYDLNNILHLAAKLAPPPTRNALSISALHMQRELAWFKEVEAIVLPSYLEMKNIEDLKPRELFSQEHKKLLRESETWMRNTADSCMLIATIILTVVFAAAFTVPGGNNQDTGIPVLSESFWFTYFVIVEALSLFCSTLCIVTFWSIMSSGFEEDQFLEILPYQLTLGLGSLSISLLGAISAFVSAYFLAFIEARERLVKRIILGGLILGGYVTVASAIFSRFSKFWINMSYPKSLSRMLSRPSSHSLFSRPHDSTRTNEEYT